MSHQPLIDRFRRARGGGPAGDLTVLEGIHPVKHALRFGAEILDAVAADREGPLRLARELAPDVADALSDLLGEVPSEVFEALSPRPPSSGVVAIARRSGSSVEALLEPTDDPAPVVYLEDPMHLGNVGAAVRVAAAAGAGGVVVTSQHDPWHPRALRGSAGLHYAVPVVAAPELPPTKRALVAVDPEGEPLRGDAVPPGAVLAFGSERRGLDRGLLRRADARVRIPMRAGVSSLNLATSVAVVLYARRRGFGSGQGPA